MGISRWAAAARESELCRERSGLVWWAARNTPTQSRVNLPTGWWDEIEQASDGSHYLGSQARADWRARHRPHAARLRAGLESKRT